MPVSTLKRLELCLTFMDDRSYHLTSPLRAAWHPHMNESDTLCLFDSVVILLVWTRHTRVMSKFTHSEHVLVLEHPSHARRRGLEIERSAHPS